MVRVPRVHEDTQHNAPAEPTHCLDQRRGILASQATHHKWACLHGSLGAALGGEGGEVNATFEHMKLFGLPRGIASRRPLLIVEYHYVRLKYLIDLYKSRLACLVVECMLNPQAELVLRQLPDFLAGPRRKPCDVRQWR